MLKNLSYTKSIFYKKYIIITAGLGEIVIELVKFLIKKIIKLSIKPKKALVNTLD